MEITKATIMSSVKRYQYFYTVLFALSSTAFITHPAYGKSEEYNEADDLPSLDFDSLMAADIQVTSAMKRLQNKSDTAASIYVLTNREIIQSGVTSVAQALTLVPGMQVRKLDNNQWAITTRSTAGRHSSKLLVMIDGQSIYNPGFAGVYWEAINVPLYDIERIEVIRGQGGLLWGSNATNGVVNIITKHTADTRDNIVQLATGTKQDYKVDFRVGGDLVNYSSFRISGGVEQTDESSKSEKDLSAHDDGKKQNLNGRVDFNINDDLSLLAQVWYNNIDMGQNLRLADVNTNLSSYVYDQYTLDYLQLMTRLDHRISPVSNQMLQVSFSSQRGEQAYYRDKFLTTDIDYQMNTLIKHTQFDWGVNYRYSDVFIEENDFFSNLSNLNHYDHFGGFIQFQFNLVPDKFKLIIGNRSEKNSFTGWEHQPMVRFLWTPESRHTIWGAVSQGVRVPSFLEYNNIARVNSSLGIRSDIIGNNDIDAEKSFSKELGYRYSEDNWGVDISLFHTKARNVLVIDPDVNDTFTYITYNFVSDGELTTYGGEATLNWSPNRKLNTEIGYSLTSYQYDLPAGTTEAIGHDAYMRQLIAKANITLTDNHHLSLTYRIEDGEAYDTKDYAVLDASWRWQINDTVTFSLTGNNLLYGKHIEYGNSSEAYTVVTFIEPSYLAQITAKF
ncbi:TonB-dependent siderophore receptor [Psychromonas sp. 14N.309.X.WAT.B.A12]|uniref:TonB-dependent receptor plug domain-containing protein n=1 Tax=unclassified Psychromonas TaxID=2614957 RepID=UPI0025B04798|nr:TonB-dependent receptor [Psychromonas sp. 14N.309.X.WAT.B.A12]MDN2663086.1 TonB-dependent receptor [Psychromonas sp. 14N.309.X.WAT.B.A12]